MRFGILLALLSAMILSSCAPLSEDECRAGNWQAIGQADGAEGRDLNYIDQHAEACAEYGVAPDVAEVAVIVAVPSATEVTRPLEDTVATEALDELHDTLAPLIVAPFWSLTVADSCCVAPKDAKLRVVADSVIEVATGVGGVGGLVGVVPPSLHAASKSTAESRM